VLLQHTMVKNLKRFEKAWFPFARSRALPQTKLNWAAESAVTFHVASRQAVEFVINDGSQAVESSSISITPGPEKLGHLATRWRSGLFVWWCGFPHCNYVRTLARSCGLFTKSNA